MYTLVSAVGKSFASDGRWEEIEIGTLPFTEIYSTYLKVIAVLSNPFLPTDVSLNLGDIRLANGGSSKTFNQFLIDNGANALPTSERLPTLATKFARYADAFHAGYKVQPTHPTASPDADLPPADKPWLYLSRPDTDFTLFGKSCMVSVNGFFHRVETDPTGAWVVDGMKSRMVSGENQIGLVSFRELGTITHIPITENMVFKQNDTLLRHRAYLDVGQDISNKTVMLVIGGYLHLFDPKSFFRVGEQTLCINFQNMPLFERFHESQNFIDLSSLPMERNEENPTMLTVDDFLSDENLTAYLTLSQSFIVLLDNQEIFVDKEYVKNTKNPNMLISYTPPIFPLVNGIGKVAEYWYVPEVGQYSLRVKDNMWHQRLYNTRNPFQALNIADNRVPEDPVRHSRAFFLKIGTDI